MRDERPRSSVNRILVRAAFLVVPVVAIGLGLSYALSSCGRDELRGLGIVSAEKTEEGHDHPPSERELSVSGRASDKLAKAEQVWRDSTAIAPGESSKDPSGERVRWFQGFGISVESKPTGAQVIVDGEDLGRTPIVASVHCDPGDDVHIEVRKPPRRPAQRTTKCREDQLVELRFDLQ